MGAKVNPAVPEWIHGWQVGWLDKTSDLLIIVVVTHDKINIETNTAWEGVDYNSQIIVRIVRRCVNSLCVPIKIYYGWNGFSQFVETPGTSHQYRFFRALVLLKTEEQTLIEWTMFPRKVLNCLRLWIKLSDDWDIGYWSCTIRRI